MLPLWLRQFRKGHIRNRHLLMEDAIPRVVVGEGVAAVDSFWEAEVVEGVAKAVDRVTNSILGSVPDTKCMGEQHLCL